MYSHILIPIDGSELSIRAAHQAIELAKLCKAKVSAMMVSPTFRRLQENGFIAPVSDILSERWEEQMTQRAQAPLQSVADHAKRAGVECETLHVLGDAPYEAIIDAANRKGCDMIAMGSHGHGGVKQFFVGSETARVLSHTKIPVVVYR